MGEKMFEFIAFAALPNGISGQEIQTLVQEMGK